MSDTTDEMEAGAGLYENYLEEQEEIKEKARNERILTGKIDRRIELVLEGFSKPPQSEPECICNEGIHDGKRIDCGCYHHK